MKNITKAATRRRVDEKYDVGERGTEFWSRAGAKAANTPETGPEEPLFLSLAPRRTEWYARSKGRGAEACQVYRLPPSAKIVDLRDPTDVRKLGFSEYVSEGLAETFRAAEPYFSYNANTYKGGGSLAKYAATELKLALWCVGWCVARAKACRFGEAGAKYPDPGGRPGGTVVDLLTGRRGQPPAEDVMGWWSGMTTVNGLKGREKGSASVLAAKISLVCSDIATSRVHTTYSAEYVRKCLDEAGSLDRIARRVDCMVESFFALYGMSRESAGAIQLVAGCTSREKKSSHIDALQTIFGRLVVLKGFDAYYCKEIDRDAAPPKAVHDTIALMRPGLAEVRLETTPDEFVRAYRRAAEYLGVSPSTSDEEKCWEIYSAMLDAGSQAEMKAQDEERAEKARTEYEVSRVGSTVYLTGGAMYSPRVALAVGGDLRDFGMRKLPTLAKVGSRAVAFTNVTPNDKYSALSQIRARLSAGNIQVERGDGRLADFWDVASGALSKKHGKSIKLLRAGDNDAFMLVRPEFECDRPYRGDDGQIKFRREKLELPFDEKI